MKTKLVLAGMILLGIISTAHAQKRIGIINFSIDGKDRMASVGMDNEGPRELYFIGSNSTRLNDTTRTSDEIVKYTEQALKEFFSSDLVSINLNRASSIPDEMNGSLWVMETITEKAAFSKLGFDEAITIKTQIYSGSSTGRNYTPVIEISMMVVNKEGKKVLKKSEKLKLKDVKVDKKLVEMEEGGNSLSFSDLRKSVKGTKEKSGSDVGSGITAIQLLDWYKQCFSNLLLSEK